MPSKGALIKDRRKRSGLTQTQVADKIGMKLSTYAKYEQTGLFKEDKLVALAGVLKVEISELNKAWANRGTVSDMIIKIRELMLKEQVTLRVMHEQFAKLHALEHGLDEEMVVEAWMQWVDDEVGKAMIAHPTVFTKTKRPL